MGNMLAAVVSIKGTRPLMWHAFGPESIPLDKRKEKTGVAGNDPEEWRNTILVTKRGQLYVRGDYIFGALRDGSKYTKDGRYSIQKKVQSTLQVVDDRVLIDRFMPDAIDGAVYDPKVATVPSDDPEEPVYLDVRSCVNPNTRSRNVRYRIAASPGWTTTFTVYWDATIVARALMEAVVIDAGKLCGLGDGRNIGMGRFVVESFEIHEAD